MIRFLAVRARLNLCSSVFASAKRMDTDFLLNSWFMSLVKLELNGTIPYSTKNRNWRKGTIHKDKKIWIGAELRWKLKLVK